MSLLASQMMGQLADAEVSAGLTTSGAAIMVVSLSAVVLLNFFCFYRVLTMPAADVQDLNAPLEIDTGDLDE